MILDAEPDAVRKARHFAKNSLTGQDDDLVADVELVIAELVSNAALHGQPPVVVRVAVSPERVRVEVADFGRVLPMEVLQSDDAMTGRGLSLVAALTSSWGVDAAGSGKVVWAEFAFDTDRADSRAAPVIDRDAILAAWGDEDHEPVPRYTVRLPGVPTEVLLAAKTHIDNVVRELSLLRSAGTHPGDMSASATRLIEAVTSDFADARTEIKRQALEAAAQGLAVVDLELHLPTQAADAGERYLAALDEADRYARSAHLLTLAPPASHRVFRHWYVRSVVNQLRAAGRGEAPPPPEPLAAVLADEVDRLSRLEDVAARLELLQKLTSSLAAATGADEMATLLAEQAARYPGVESVRVYLATDRGTFRSAAWHNPHNTTRDRYVEFGLDSDLPGAAVVRSGEPAFLRSRQQIHQHLPELDGYYPEERALHILPVAAGSETLGLLGITIIAGQLDDDDQLDFVNALAGLLASALARIQPERSAGS